MSSNSMPGDLPMQRRRTHRARPWRGASSLALLLLLASGCGGSGHVPVAGRVLFDDGEAVRTGRIEFRARDQPVRGTGTIDAEGHFRLQTDDGKDGLPPGEYDAVIVQMVIVEQLSLAAHGHGRQVPRRYSDYYTSGLAVEVPQDGTTALTLTLSASD